MSTINAPSPRELHTAVWSGRGMIVWGGARYNANPLNTGGRYDPASDTWSATSSVEAPVARYLHTGVWTGSEMIIWGGIRGSQLDTGGRYCAIPGKTSGRSAK